MANLNRAKKAFSDFTGHKAVKLKRSRLDDQNVTGWKMGPVVGIAYEAKRDGTTKQYFHEFKKSARPDLVAKDDGSKLYIDGGKYKVTDRGIEDMPALFVVNPSPRAGKSKRKPMARRATRRRSTVKRRTRQVAVFNSNPVRRRRRRRASVRSFARNPVRRRARRVGARRTVRRFRRNPSGRGVAVNFGKMLMPAIGIGAGAVGTEIIMGYLPIPANFKTGVLRHVTKGAVGIATGMLLGKVFKQKRLGTYFALGAVAIAVHDAIKEVIVAKMPSVPFGMYRGPIRGSLGYYSPAQVTHAPMGRYVAPIHSSLGGASTQHGDGSGNPNFNA